MEETYIRIRRAFAKLELRGVCIHSRTLFICQTDCHSDVTVAARNRNWVAKWTSPGILNVIDFANSSEISEGDVSLRKLAQKASFVTELKSTVNILFRRVSAISVADLESWWIEYWSYWTEDIRKLE